MAASAKLRDPKWFEGHMNLKGLDCEKVAARCRRRGRKVSRQMISQLKNGTRKSCTPELAATICEVLKVPPFTLFAMPDERNEMTQTATPKSAA